MRNIPFMRAYGDAEALYNVNITEDEFIEIGLIAWEKIGNKQYRYFDYIVRPDGCITEIKLPEECDQIEAVYCGAVDYASNLNTNWYGNTNERYEAYNKYPKFNDKPTHIVGKLLSNYNVQVDTIKFSQPVDYPVCILCKEVIKDEDGLPYINSKELNAIALYVAFVYHQKRFLMSKNNADMTICNMFKLDWMKALTSAKQPEEVSQNDLNDMLDSISRSNRKQYGKSFNFS